MSNPVIVRGEELARAFAQQEVLLDQDQVFSQRPGTPFGVDMPYDYSDQMLSLPTTCAMS